MKVLGYQTFYPKGDGVSVHTFDNARAQASDFVTGKMATLSGNNGFVLVTLTEAPNPTHPHEFVSVTVYYWEDKK